MGSNIATKDSRVSKKKWGIYGSTLKLIAIITMLIDHTAATILDRILISKGLYDLDMGNTKAVEDFFNTYGMLYNIDGIMRLIGRIGFPLFCFLLIEGFQHTRNKWQYTLRLAIFSLISEIPFDLAFKNQMFDFSYQNVFFTLTIGMLVMIGYETISEKARDKKWLPALGLAGAVATGALATYFVSVVVRVLNSIFLGFNYAINISFNTQAYILFGIVLTLISFIIFGVMCKKDSLQIASVRFGDQIVLVAGMVLAGFLITDYSAFGIFTIALMYGLRKNKVKSGLGGCVALTVMSIYELTSFVALIPIALYNGQRGLKLKYLFYAFYPVHLFILYLICYFMKIV